MSKTRENGQEESMLKCRISPLQPGSTVPVENNQSTPYRNRPSSRLTIWEFDDGTIVKKRIWKSIFRLVWWPKGLNVQLCISNCLFFFFLSCFLEFIPFKVQSSKCWFSHFSSFLICEWAYLWLLDVFYFSVCTFSGIVNDYFKIWISYFDEVLRPLKRSQ